MTDGVGCKCAARCESECVCGADWTPREVYRLRAEIEQLRDELAATEISMSDRLNEKNAEIQHLRDELSLFHTAVEHVTGCGNAERSVSADGWSMVPEGYLSDLRCTNERLRSFVIDCWRGEIITKSKLADVLGLSMTETNDLLNERSIREGWTSTEYEYMDGE